MSLGGISPAALNPALVMQWSNQLFATLDAGQKGYIDRNDLQVALESSVVPTSKTAPGEQLFQALDRNGDGKVTVQELTASVQTLADHLFSNLRQTNDPKQAADASTTEGGNPGRFMALLKLVDLVSAYGPANADNTRSLPSSGALNVKA